MSPYFYVMTAQEQGKFIPLQVQRKQPINCVYADRGRECNTVKSSITSLEYLFYLITAHKQSYPVVLPVSNIDADNLQNDKLEQLIKMYSYTRTSSSDNSMSDEAEREKIIDETHELEDAEQDQLEEDDDDDYDEDETDQNT